jgi:hypothetical protein
MTMGRQKFMPTQSIFSEQAKLFRGGDGTLPFSNCAA